MNSKLDDKDKKTILTEYKESKDFLQKLEIPDFTKIVELHSLLADNNKDNVSEPRIKESDLTLGRTLLTLIELILLVCYEIDSKYKDRKEYSRFKSNENLIFIELLALALYFVKSSKFYRKIKTDSTLEINTLSLATMAKLYKIDANKEKEFSNHLFKVIKYRYARYQYIENLAEVVDPEHAEYTNLGSNPILDLINNIRDLLHVRKLERAYEDDIFFDLEDEISNSNMNAKVVLENLIIIATIITSFFDDLGTQLESLYNGKNLKTPNLMNVLRDNIYEENTESKNVLARNDREITKNDIEPKEVSNDRDIKKTNSIYKFIGLFIFFYILIDFFELIFDYSLPIIVSVILSSVLTLVVFGVKEQNTTN